MINAISYNLLLKFQLLYLTVAVWGFWPMDHLRLHRFSILGELGSPILCRWRRHDHYELQMLTVTFHCEVLYGSSTGDQAAKTVPQVLLLPLMLFPRKLVYLLKHNVTWRRHLCKTTDFPSWLNFLKTVLDGQKSPNRSSMVWSKSRGRWEKPTH